VSDLLSNVCIGVACGATASPFLQSLGLDPIAFGFGMGGAVIAQTLISNQDETPTNLRKTVAILMGSTLFATVFAPACVLWLTIGDKPMALAYQVAIAAILGAFAPTFMAAGRAVVDRYATPGLKRFMDRILLGGGDKNA